MGGFLAASAALTALTAASSAASQAQSNAQAEAAAVGIEHGQAAEQAAAAEEALATQRQLRRVLASQRAFFGAAGVSPSEGSAAAAAVGAAREAAEGTAASNRLAQRRIDAMEANRQSLLSGRVSPVLAGTLSASSSALNNLLLYRRLRPGETKTP